MDRRRRELDEQAQRHRAGRAEGLVIQNGQPYTFHGYVDAYDEKIASVEFSMDFGKTWTKHDLGDTDVNKLVWFDFTWTPQEESCLLPGSCAPPRKAAS